MSKNAHITEETISKITTGLAQVSPLFNELIPSFTTRYIDKLNRALEQANAKDNAVSKMSALYYFINKERPFPSGNKRIALALLLHSLAQEGKWLKATPEELYEFAHWVSMAPVDAKEEVIAYIEKFIRKHEVRMDRSMGNKQ